MARPIKETPILKGKDAKKFMEQMDKLSRAPVSKKERDAIRENYEKIHKIAKF
jgi:ribosomal protein L7/L12